LHFLNFKKKQIVEKSIQANENKSKCKHEKAWKTELNRMHNDNRERIFKKNEGIQKSEQEFDLIKEFLETKKNYKIILYEWFVEHGQSHKGQGDLVVYDGNTFIVIEAKCVKNNKTSRLKKVREQAEKYFLHFKERLKDRKYFSKSFIEHFRNHTVKCATLTDNNSGFQLLYVETST